MNYTQTLKRTNVVAQEPGNVVSDMNGEIVMLSIQQGNYYNLGEMGGVIWSKINEPTLISKLIKDLTDEYDVSPLECEEQVMSFLDHLVKEHLITVQDPE